MGLGSSLRHVAREAALWTVVVAGGFAGVYFFDDLRAAVSGAAEQVAVQMPEAREPQSDARETSERIVHLRAASNGHFFTRSYVNGRAIDVMVDTGATGVALTYEDAQTAGVLVGEEDFTALVRTANGTARTAPVTLDRVRIGDITIRNVPASVAERGKLAITLLGMSFIRRLSRIEMRGNELVLIQ